MRGEWRSAASSFRKAVSRSPGNWAGWWMLGFAEEQRGNVSAAVDAYKTSLRVDTSLFDARKNPYAARTRLKGRVLLESLDSRVYRLALPASEQMAQPDLVTSFQRGHVAVHAVPGAPVPAGAPVPERSRREAGAGRPGRHVGALRQREHPGAPAGIEHPGSAARADRHAGERADSGWLSRAVSGRARADEAGAAGPRRERERSDPGSDADARSRRRLNVRRPSTSGRTGSASPLRPSPRART